MATDPMDEFQFKPLTEGLGFHKKSAAKNDTATNSHSLGAQADFSLANSSSVESIAMPEITQPLPRKERPSSTPLKPGRSQEVLDKMNSKKLDFKDPYLGKKPFPKDHLKEQTSNRTSLVLNTSLEKRTSYVPSNIQLGAGFLDFLLILSAQLLCLIVLIAVTQADLYFNLLNPDSSGLIYVSLVGLFMVLSFVYFSAHRVFLGYTPGEWVFDQKSLLPEQMQDWKLKLRWINRILLNIFSGFITLPLLSMILNKDLAGQLTGTQIYRRNL